MQPLVCVCGYDCVCVCVCVCECVVELEQVYAIPSDPVSHVWVVLKRLTN